MSENQGTADDKAGPVPAWLTYIGEHPVASATVNHYVYSRRGVVVERQEGPADEDLSPPGPTRGIHWVDAIGLSDVPAVWRVAALLGLHPLAVEDILNTRQRPKMEETADYLYLILKAPDFGEDGHRVVLEQVAVALGQGVVLSFQERTPDIFQPIIDRLARRQVPLREASADFLAYTLIDAVVDQYLLVLEDVGERLEELEDAALAGSQGGPALQAIHSLKRELLVLRRSAWPLREMVSNLLRDGSPLIQESTHVYLRDLHDHAVQVMETLEMYRDMLASLYDLHLSSLSARTNAVMKVLTLVATVFIPLTFIAGVYGMNFRYMPELTWRWGYPALWVVMLGIAGGMLLVFRRKGWI